MTDPSLPSAASTGSPSATLDRDADRDGTVADLAKVLRRPHLHDGTWSSFRGRTFGAPAGDLAAINNSFGFGGHNVAVAFTNAYATGA